MRLVPIEKLNVGESLGYAIRSQDGRVLLAANSEITASYLERLKGFKILSVYIEDELFDDVDISPALSENTKMYVMEVVSQMYKDFKKKLTINEAGIRKSANGIASDVFSHIRSPINLYNIYAIDDKRVLHAVNTAVITAAISYFCEMPVAKIIDYITAALLHDIMLESFDENDCDHAVKADEFLKTKRSFNNIVRASILMHHENYDGSGGPKKFAGDKIYEGARIISVADQYDRLVYGLGCEKQQAHLAVEYLSMMSGTKLDPGILNKFAKCVAVFPTGATVLLNNGYRAVVMKQNEGLPTRPIVKLLMPKKEYCMVFNLVKNRTLFIDDVEI